MLFCAIMFAKFAKKGRGLLPKWSDEYSIDNPEIDEQHKKLFELASAVEAISDRSVSKKRIKDLLTEFFHYMRDHFRAEEEYMQSINFPELEPHKRIHKDIIQSMVHLISTIKTTNDLKERLYLISKRWLLEHILFEDMKILEFVQMKALTSSGGALADEISYIDDNTEHQGYLYACGCEDKMHDVSLDVHRQIQVSEKDVRCRVCNEKIVFIRKEDSSI